MAVKPSRIIAQGPSDYESATLHLHHAHTLNIVSNLAINYTRYIISEEDRKAHVRQICSYTTAFKFWKMEQDPEGDSLEPASTSYEVDGFRPSSVSGKGSGSKQSGYVKHALTRKIEQSLQVVTGKCLMD